jgi:hypothetical protein
MKRAYSPKEIAAKKWVTLPWDEKWSKPFGFPAENASWFISGASASGKSSFVMQLGKELCNYGTVLYMSYEEKINQSFQRRMGYLKMNEVQGKFRVVTEGSLEEVIARLKKPKSPKFIIIDSFQVAGWDYPQAVELMETFTVEELNLMCCFNTSSRKRLIDDMKSVTLNDMDGEIAELMYKTIRKLEAMTDAEFEELYIMPDGMMDD